jgi:hypothetical protein
MGMLRMVLTIVVIAGLGVTACSSDGDGDSAGTTKPDGSDGKGAETD